MYKRQFHKHGNRQIKLNLYLFLIPLLIDSTETCIRASWIILNPPSRFDASQILNIKRLYANRSQPRRTGRSFRSLATCTSALVRD